MRGRSNWRVGLFDKISKSALLWRRVGWMMGASPESKPPGLTLSATLNHLLLLGCPRVGQFVGLSLWVLSGNGDDFEQKNIKRSARECRADDEFNNPSGWCFAFHVVQGVISSLIGASEVANHCGFWDWVRISFRKKTCFPVSTIILPTSHSNPSNKCSEH